jgi:meso-butanediol dehydrogenase/(S,S)-butanediol dehydrogenase/diacetyl reductase
MEERFGIDMKGKVALITGGGTGLGAAISRRFSKNGASVVIMGRREVPIRAVAEETNGRAVIGDVTNVEDLKRAVKATMQEFGGLDIAVANAGIISVADVMSITREDWQSIVDINLTGVMNTAKAAIPSMIERGGGSIINISSVAGLMGISEAVGYCSTKAGLSGLTRSLAIDYGSRNIRVNTLCPGWFQSEMSNKEMEELAREKGITIEEAIDRVTRYLPLKRMATADEIAACVEFLASDYSSFVTGTTLVADGGGSIVDVGMLGFE